MNSLKTFTFAATLLAVSAFATPHVHANPCKSHFQKVTSALKKVGPPIMKLICQLGGGETKDPAKIKKCNDDYEKAVAMIDKLTKSYNTQAHSSKIGPRGLGFNATYTGTLLAERVFISPPAKNTEVTITMNVTGGKYKKDWKVHFCGIDEDGKSVNYSSKSFKGTKKTSFKKTFKNMLGKRVQVYLSKKAGTNGVKYNVRADGKGVPSFKVKPKKSRIRRR